jgi:hypothetical protein
MVNAMNVNRPFVQQPWNVVKGIVGITNDGGFDDVNDVAVNSPVMPGIQMSFFMHHFNTSSVLTVANMKPLRNAPDVAYLEGYADDMCYFTLKWFNDFSSYGFRVVPYDITVGTRVGNTVDMGNGNLAEKFIAERSGTEFSTSGTWMESAGLEAWSSIAAAPSALGNPNEPTYTGQVWYALCAAFEREVPGAATLWTKIYGTNGSNGGISNLLTWRNGYGSVPAWNRWPRNK